MERFIGSDSHKDTITACVIDALGRHIETVTAVNDGRGFRKMERLIERHQPVRVGIEGSGSNGFACAQRLVGSEVDVREVPPHLTRRARRTYAKGKSDALDGLLIARVVARDEKLPRLRFDAASDELKALVDHREALIAEASRHRNRAHALLIQIRPGYQRAVPALNSDRRITKAEELVARDRSVRGRLVRDYLARLRELTKTVDELEKEIEVMVRAAGTRLTELAGIGVIVAAQILGEVGDVKRLSSQASFGSLSGTAPIPASSGRTTRWRLNRGGNRKLNYAIHMMAVAQRRCDPRAREYLARKIAAGKTNKEAMRCLKRHLARLVFRQLVADAEEIS
jgi:transposase